MASEQKNPANRIWVLADDRSGNRSQCIGIADRLNLPYTVKEIRYNFLAKLPNFLRWATRIGLDGKSLKIVKGPWPEVVIAAGRRSAPVARFIKRKSPKTRLLHLMWPDAGAKDFDTIVLPSHDRERKETPQILRVLGAPHGITPKTLEKASKEWFPKFADLPKPRIALLVGGSSKHGTFQVPDYHRLGALAAAMATQHHGSLLVTTSRRTGEEGEEALKSHIDHLPNYFHHFGSEGSNPYQGMLAVADAIIVTADSVGMCSEACSTGKSVYFFAPTKLSKKHGRFISTLIATGYALPLIEDLPSGLPLTSLKRSPLDTASTIAKHIRTQWLGFRD